VALDGEKRPWKKERSRGEPLLFESPVDGDTSALTKGVKVQNKTLTGNTIRGTHQRERRTEDTVKIFDLRETKTNGRTSGRGNEEDHAGGRVQLGD